MTANELADEVMEHYKAESPRGFNVNWMKEVATMLRQQQLRIDQLLETQDYLYKKHDEQQTEISLYKLELTLHRAMIQDLENALKKAGEK